MGADKKSALDPLLAQAAERKASDIILVVGSGVTLRVNGVLTPATGKALTAEDLRRLLLPLLTSEQTKELEAKRVVDFSFMRAGLGRFRANIHYQRGTLAASIRLLPGQMPTLESLHLPAILGQLIERRQGLDSADGADWMRKDVDDGSADQPDQHSPAGTHHHD